MARTRATMRALWAAIPLVLIAALIVFWNWDWFIPLIDCPRLRRMGPHRHHPASAFAAGPGYARSR